VKKSKNTIKQLKSNKLEQAATKLIKRSDLALKLKAFGKKFGK
jgi:hypothetical protein